MSACRHQWLTMQDTTRERCALCKTVYPCAFDCQHVDCRVDKGQELPDWIRFVRKED